MGSKQLRSETLYSLNQIRRRITLKRCQTTLRNWAREGCRSRSGQQVVLETTLVAGVRHTSLEAYQRFLAELDR